MWRTGSKKSRKLPATGLLSVSGLGGLDTTTSSHQQQTWNSRSGRGAAGNTTAAGSISCSIRDDALHELVAQHEQVIQSLSEKVMLLEDTLEKLQEDVAPALKLVSAVKDVEARHHLLTGAPGKIQTPQGTPNRTRDQGLTQQTGAAATTPAAAAPGVAKDAARDMADVQQELQVSEGPTAADALCRTLADLAGWHTSATQQQQQQHTQGSVLGREQAAGVTQQDREECASMHSFCTLTSYASTQVSGPALMTDLRPAGKAASRVPQQQQQQYQQQPGLQLPSWGADAAKTGLVGGICSSWPLQMGLEEECSPEEIQKMMELVLNHSAQQQCSQHQQNGHKSTAGEDSQPHKNSSSTSAEEQQQQQQQQQGEVPPEQALCDGISCLALHAECDEEVRKQLCTGHPEFLPCMIQLLQGVTCQPDQARLQTAQAAAHLLWFISRSAPLRSYLQQQEHLLPVLLGLLSVQDVALARAAAFTLNNMAHEQDYRFAMVEAGAVVGLTDMLSGCDALGQEAAAAALMNLASEESSIRGTIVACNGIPALVAVLKYGGPAAQEAAAAALENLSLDSECEAALAGEGAIEGLLQVLKDGTTAAQASAAGALRNLAVNEALEDRLLAAGTIPLLLGLVARPQEDVGVRTAALEGLRNLAASSTRSGDALLQAGGAAVLVDAARALPAATARSAALGALLVLSMDETHRQAILAAGAGGVLVHAALSGSSLAKEYSARALANLATTEAARAELLCDGAATVLSFLLKSQLALLSAAAAAGDAAGARSVGCTLAVARALQNLSKSKAGCKILQDAGCITPLAAALQVHGLVATAATSALCSLCTNRRSLQELANADGCNKLVAALSQPKLLTLRGQRQALKLLKRLVKGVGSCRAAVEAQIAAAGLNIQLVV